MGGSIKVGVGGWVYEPWRGAFYPPGLPHKQELDFASRALTAIEVNGTYYGSQKPATFASWAKAVPDGFTFTLKASRYCTNRKVLADAGDSIAKFVGQGIVELGDRLGPILWQFMATKRFDPDDFAAFLKLLPHAHQGVPLRHALEVRHESFDDPAFEAMARDAGVAVVLAESDEHPRLDFDTADFRYARWMRSVETEADGYPAQALDDIATQARQWAKGGDAFLFFISAAKVRNPAAARALIARL